MSFPMNGNKPVISSLKDYLWIIFCGMCMGASDIVPGISGGTMALIIGIYENLICSIRSFTLQTFALLLKGRFRLFWETTGVNFLLALVLGMGFSLFFLANFFDYILHHATYRSYLYGGFFGLILASMIYCARQMKTWKLIHLAALGIGCAITFFLTTSSLPFSSPEPAQVARLHLWPLLCGAIAVCAMLLPGISGSYLLTILGIYPAIIAALADFAKGVLLFSFDEEAFYLLASMGIGIVLGALLFSHIVSWLLRKYHDITLAVLVGFMVGSLSMVWPFWSYGYRLNPLKLEKGPELFPLEPFIPNNLDHHFWITVLLMVLAFGLVFVLERIALNSRKNNCLNG